jgi:hypothetical protein
MPEYDDTRDETPREPDSTIYHVEIRHGGSTVFSASFLDNWAAINWARDIVARMIGRYVVFPRDGITTNTYLEIRVTTSRLY